jgi:hypothetical protein
MAVQARSLASPSKRQTATTTANLAVYRLAASNRAVRRSPPRCIFNLELAGS